MRKKRDGGKRVEHIVEEIGSSKHEAPPLLLLRLLCPFEATSVGKLSPVQVKRLESRPLTDLFRQIKKSVMGFWDCVWQHVKRCKHVHSKV